MIKKQTNKPIFFKVNDVKYALGAYRLPKAGELYVAHSYAVSRRDIIKWVQSDDPINIMAALGDYDAARWICSRANSA
jgi:hypothetical protein